MNTYLPRNIPTIIGTVVTIIPANKKLNPELLSPNTNPCPTSIATTEMNAASPTLLENQTAPSGTCPMLGLLECINPNKSPIISAPPLVDKDIPTPPIVSVSIPINPSINIPNPRNITSILSDFLISLPILNTSFSTSSVGPVSVSTSFLLINLLC